MHRLVKRESYVRAMTAEREAWDEVKQALPGSPAFDQVKWKQWRAAMHVVASAIDETRQAMSTPQPTHDRPGRKH